MKKLELYMTGGFVVPVVDTFEEVMAILDGKAVAPEEYIYMQLEDHCRTAVRKCDVIGIAEYQENENQC